MEINEALYRLCLYNEKVEMLRRSRFVQRVMADGGITSTTSAGEDKTLTIDLKGPDEDNLAAFVTTYRFFIQPRDKIDRPHMKEVYEALRDEFGFAKGENREAIEHAIMALDSADAYFAGLTPLEINGEPLSRATLHNVIIYGGTAHANRDKKAIYDSWAAMPTFPLITFHFLTVVLDALGSIMSFQGLNARAISYLESQQVAAP